MPNSDTGDPDHRRSASTDAAPPATPAGPSSASSSTPTARSGVDETRSGPVRWLLIVATVIPLVAVLVFALLARRAETAAPSGTEPLAIPVVFQPGSTTAGCVALDKALPDTLDGRPKRALVAAEPGVAAWGNPPVVMRCGISDPAELTCSSSLTIYNTVTWLTLPDAGSTTFIAVDRPSRVAITLDDSVGIGAVQALSNVVAAVMPARPVCTEGVIVPADRP